MISISVALIYFYKIGYRVTWHDESYGRHVYLLNHNSKGIEEDHSLVIFSIIISYTEWRRRVVLLDPYRHNGPADVRPTPWPLRELPASQ
jgi:hypothetical protein